MGQLPAQTERDGRLLRTRSKGRGRGEEGDGAPSGPSPSEPRIPESELIHRLCSVDVAEVFSPLRVSSDAVKFGLTAGDAMDLTTGWDLSRKYDRDKAGICG